LWNHSLAKAEACLLIYLFRLTNSTVWQKSFFLLKMAFIITVSRQCKTLKNTIVTGNILSLKQWQLDKQMCLEQDFFALIEMSITEED